MSSKCNRLNLHKIFNTNENHNSALDMPVVWISGVISTTVVWISGVIDTTVVRISGVINTTERISGIISTTVVRIASVNLYSLR